MMKHQLIRLRDNYLPLLFGMLLASVCADAQVYQEIKNNSAIRRLRADSTFTPPFGPTANLGGDFQNNFTPRMFYRTTDSTLVIWTGHQWLPIGKVTTLQQAVDAQGSITAYDDSGAGFDSDGAQFSMVHPLKVNLAATSTPTLQPLVEVDNNTGASVAAINGISSHQSFIIVRPDTIFLDPHRGNIQIDTLKRVSSSSWVMQYDSTTKMVGYMPVTAISGAGSTLQQVVDAQGSITANDASGASLDSDGAAFVMSHPLQLSIRTNDEVKNGSVNVTDYVNVQTDKNNSHESHINVFSDSIMLAPHAGKLRIDSLARRTSIPYAVGRDSVTGEVYYTPISWQKVVDVSPSGYINATSSNGTFIRELSSALTMYQKNQVSIFTDSDGGATSTELTLNSSVPSVNMIARDITGTTRFTSISVQPDSGFVTNYFITQNALKVSQGAVPSVTGSTGANATKVLQVLGATGGNTSNSGSFASAGNGASILIKSGAGGAVTGTPTTGVGGNGGLLEIRGNNGGNANTFGGNGGGVLIQAGDAGRGTVTGTGGVSGPVLVKGGNASVSTNGNGGYIYVHGGIADGTGKDGTVFMAISESNTQRGNVLIGNSDPDYRKLLSSELIRTSLADTGWAVSGSTAGATYNTTTNPLLSVAGSFTSTSTRTSGSNDLTNIGVFASASGAQNNYAGWFDGKVMISTPTIGTYNTVASLLAPNNTGSGWNTQLVYGVSNTTGNAADWRFYYDGSNSSANRIDFGIAGVANPVLSYTRGGQVAINTTSPAASAVLDISSTSQGLLPPRMTTTQRDAISSPAEGLTIYNLTDHKMQTWDGSAWQNHW